MKTVFIVVFIIIGSLASATTYYVAKNGNDHNPGTTDLPWASWEKAFSTVKAGDIVYIRGGEYTPLVYGSNHYVYDHDGTSANPIRIYNYPGEKPVLNCYTVNPNGNQLGIGLYYCEYWHLRGLEVENVKQSTTNDMAMPFFISHCSNVVIENCIAHDSQGNGFDITYPTGDISLINCDSYNNIDILRAGNSANGFATNGTAESVTVSFTGCRAWNCSDDGFDSMAQLGVVTHNSCWAFNIGSGAGGDGMGFKLGNIPVAGLSIPQRIVTNCIAYGNKNYGFDRNEGNMEMILLNNIAYLNHNGFVTTIVPSPSKPVTLKNNISYNNTGSDSFEIGETGDHNNWNGGVTVTDADFVSLDGEQLLRTRKADGSLPDITFLHLASGSDLIDKGVNVGLPYGGSAPDLGAFESGTETYVPPPTPVYVSSVIENATPSLVEMTYNLTLANLVPATSAFTINVNSVARSVTAVSISGTKVLLTLSSPVLHDDVVSVAYTKPSANPLKTPAGAEAASISAQSVTNKVLAIIPLFVSSSVENGSPSKIEMIYNQTMNNVAPATSAFTVRVNSVSRAVSSVSISGTKVLLTLSNPVVYGDAVTVEYTKPNSSPLKSASGGEAASLAAQTVTNRVSPVLPVYLSSAIENATPSRLEMTYSLTLTNSVPAASAFAVKVNSVVRSVTAVAVSGNKVILTLASPVVYGNVVTVAYTKPAINPVKTAAGGEAASIGAQTVANRMNYVNFPPVVVVNYTPVSLSGFVGEISASKSYDPNNDKLSYEWIAPENVPISSSNSSTVKFLSPVVSKPTTYDFIVKISDGKIIQSKTLLVEVIPYKPELEEAKILKVEASTFQSPNYPYNILDGNIGTAWAADGTEQWLLLYLKEPFKVDHVKLAFQSGMKSESYFDILGSADNITWEPVLTKSASCGFSGNPQVFGFPATKAEKEYSFIKLVGQCNSVNTWNYISELKLFGFGQKTLAFKELSQIIIYPNPVNEYVNISIKEQTLKPDFIRIINLSGKIVLEEMIEPEIKELQIPISLLNGVYIVHVGSGELTLFTQKLVVNK